jgi:hypothetical protein
MKYILSLLTALSMLLLSSCGGGSEAHDHNGTEAGECCGEGGECCKDANASE